MEKLENSEMLHFKNDTLEAVRKIFNIQNRDDMDKSIDILSDWIRQQDHFIKKDYSRNYLERLIIRSKCSVERAKGRIDKMCTARTHLPYFFGIHCVADYEIDGIEDAMLPCMTKDYHRVYLVRNWSKCLTAENIQHYFQRVMYFTEYMCQYDYIQGGIIVIDYRNLDLMVLLKAVDPVIFQKASNLVFNSFGFRVKAIHILSASKLISLVISLFKQVLSEKIGSRIMVHETIEALYDYVDMDILPEDYGGREIPLNELNKKWLKVLSSNEFMDYMKEMDKAKIEERLRLLTSPSNEYTGIPGTFKSLTVD